MSDKLIPFEKFELSDEKSEHEELKTVFDRPSFYALEGREVRESTIEEYLSTVEETRRAMKTIALDVVAGVRVSTIFLFIDHGFADPRPVLFETMLFDDWEAARAAQTRLFQLGEAEIAQWRFHTYDEAEAFHNEMVRVMRAYEDKLEAATPEERQQIGKKILAGVYK